MDKEATPILGPIMGINLKDYKDSLIERFANPNIKDSVARICTESAAKLPKFLIPTIQENLATGGSIKLATLVLVAWCYYSDKEADQNGQPLEINDVLHEELHAAASSTVIDPLAFIKQESLFGDLAENKHFAESYTSLVQELYQGSDIKTLMQSLL